jgi:hypothetical protein
MFKDHAVINSKTSSRNDRQIAIWLSLALCRPFNGRMADSNMDIPIDRSTVRPRGNTCNYAGHDAGRMQPLGGHSRVQCTRKWFIVSDATVMQPWLATGRGNND